MSHFDHEKLDVYQAALDFVEVANVLLETIPRGRAFLADQIQRAAVSIPLNIAEEAGEYSRKDKARFYRMALRSGTESAALLDVCRRLKFGNEAEISSGRDLLLRIVSMLTKMANRLGGRGWDGKGLRRIGSGVDGNGIGSGNGSEAATGPGTEAVG